MFKQLFKWITPPPLPATQTGQTKTMERDVKILKTGPAMRVIFFYPGEEGTYVDHPEVTLYENGIVHIRSNQEETTTHLQNCEILWNFELESEDRTTKVRLLKPKAKSATAEIRAESHTSSQAQSPEENESQGAKNSPSKSPELG